MTGFDFDIAVSAPFRMQPGLRRLPAGAKQLTPLGPGSRHQREKLAVLSAFASQALTAREGFDATPALAAVCTQAAQEHPQHFAWDRGRASALGVSVGADGGVAQDRPGPFGLGDEIARCLGGLAPAWRLAGLLSLAFAEDFAIVDGAGATIPWLAVALPSHWAPEEKVGRHFADVHAPVADNTLIVNAAAALTRMVTGSERWERFVWNVSPSPRLHAHPARVDPRRWALTPIERAWFRSERQNFIPLPERREAVFLIGVDVQPLAQVLAAQPGRAARLHDAVASMSPAVLDYRSLAGVREPLLAWLAAQA
jgi:dimethylamine monooxygenase subunit A